MIVGVDANSKKVAMVFGHTKWSARPHVFQSNGSFHWQRSQWAYEEMSRALDLFGLARSTIFIETPLLPTGRMNVMGTVVQSFVSGALQVAFAEWECEVVFVRVTEWKKSVIGRGNATKDDCAKFVLRHWPRAHTFAQQTVGRGKQQHVVVDQDIIDASCIFLHGVGVVAEGLGR